MTRLLSLVALLGFLLSLAAHLAALLGVDVAAKLPLVWLLHVGIFVVFIPFAFHSRKVLGPKLPFSEIRKLFPGWVIGVGVGIFGYAIVNFLWFILATHGGSPGIREGKFILQNHGHLIRELTAAEYTAFKANEVRGFSGHWMAFYFIPFAYFMFCRKSTPTIKRMA